MNILLTSVGRRTYMVNYFKNALNGAGLVHASNSELTYSVKQADKYVITPLIYDFNYIEFILDYCVVNKINVIISLFDIDLPVLSKNKEKFKEINIDVIISNEDVVDICNDKWKTYCFLSSLGLKQPETYISLEEVKNNLKIGKVKFPLIIKPRWGMGSIGIMQVDSFEELDILYKKLYNEIFHTYLKFESQKDSNACILLQEKLKGKEYGLDILNDLNGNFASVVAKHKVAMRSGETDIAQIVDNKTFTEMATLISQKLGHIANLDVDCFVTDKNEIYILEMNCRFGGQYPFSHIAGANFPLQIVKWLNGEQNDENILHSSIGMIACKDLMPVII